MAWRNHLDDELRAGHRGGASTTFAYLAHALAHVGQLDEAERLAAEAVEYGSPDDVITQCIAASAYALIESERGAFDQAAYHAQGAMQIADNTDWLTLKAEVHLDRAEIHARSGDIASARASAQEALALFRVKESLVGQDRADAVIAALDRRARA